MNEEDRCLLAEIHRGATLLFENAEQLHNEAEILGARRAFCREVCLHQISIEECSKIDMLGATAMELLTGHSVDLAKVARSMRSHQVKNFILAYDSLRTEAEREAQHRGDHEAASKIFRKQQKAIHECLNTSKNASLYVDLIDGKFVAPSDLITETQAVGMHALNGDRLAVSASFLRLLDRMVTEPDKMAALAQDLWDHLESVPADQAEKALREWLDQTKSRFKPEHA
jgi:AbiV family abortive infection protein